MTRASSAEALAARLAALGGGEVSIASTRQALADEFGPRAERAVQRYAREQGVVIGRESWGGAACLTLTPPTLRSDATILYFFGGGYVSGAPDYEVPLVAPLCLATGMRAVLPAYPLAPEHPFPAALDVAIQVYDAVSVRGPLVLSGESAGGGLALGLIPALAALPDPPPLPRALCLFSPWVDLTPTAQDRALTTDPTLSPAHLRLYADAYCGAGDRTRVSPAHQDLSALPPTLITTGTRDILRPQLQGLAAHPAVRLRVWPDMWHVFELYAELPEAAQSLQQAAEFISRWAKA